MASKLVFPKAPGAEAPREEWTEHFALMIRYMNRLMRQAGPEVIDLTIGYKDARQANGEQRGTLIQISRCGSNRCTRGFHTTYASGIYDEHDDLQVRRDSVTEGDVFADRFVDLSVEEVKAEIDRVLAIPGRLEGSLDPRKVNEYLQRIFGNGVRIIRVDAEGVSFGPEMND